MERFAISCPQGWRRVIEMIPPACSIAGLIPLDFMKAGIPQSPIGRSACIDVLKLSTACAMHVSSHMGEEYNVHIVTYDAENAWPTKIVLEVQDSMKAIMLKLALS
jgi:hypothetical protein